MAFDANEYDSQEFKRITLERETVSAIEFDACTFVKCSFPETVFEKCKFRDCGFRDCNLSLVKLPGCVFSNTRFESCQLLGINWTETAWAKSKFVKPVDFIDCALNHSTFIGLNLKRVCIARCSARDVDFAEANLTEADCTKTDFNDSRFLHTDLTKADFTGATNYAIAPGLNTLKKTKFSLPAAMALLYGLDIVLTE